MQSNVVRNSHRSISYRNQGWRASPNQSQKMDGKATQERIIFLIPGAVDLPSKIDVLLGRGKPFNVHPGNRLLHELVENYFERYDKMTRDAKTGLAEEIVTIVHSFSGQFLKQDAKAGMWVPVSQLEARNKVTHSFRRKREFDLKATQKAQPRTAAGSLSEGQDDGGGKRLRLTTPIDGESN